MQNAAPATTGAGRRRQSTSVAANQDVVSSNATSNHFLGTNHRSWMTSGAGTAGPHQGPTKTPAAPPKPSATTVGPDNTATTVPTTETSSQPSLSHLYSAPTTTQTGRSLPSYHFLSTASDTPPDGTIHSARQRELASHSVTRDTPPKDSTLR